MYIPNNRWLLLLLLLISICFITTYGKAGRGGGGRGGGGSRGGSSRGSSSRGGSSRGDSVRTSTRYRATSRPATYRPVTSRPAPAPTQRPAPRPTQKPQPASPKPPSVTPKPSAPDEAVARQPGSNPNFKETNPVQGSSDKQPAYNPNYKPDGNAPGGPPPPYSPGGQPAPGAPLGPPPPYQPGSTGQRPPYPAQPGAQPPPYPVQPGAQPPPYSGPPGRPPAYPGLPTHPGSAPYPVQPGSPGAYPQQPGGHRPYPVQPNYPGGYQQQPGVNRPYPVQPGFYQPGANRPYPQQPLGTNVWKPQSGMPSPPYMNYGGLPTGTNMYTKPHKQKGFLGSVMSVGGDKSYKKNKYYGKSYGGVGGIGGSGIGRVAGTALAVGSVAMLVILPVMAMRAASPLFMPRLGYMPFGYMPMHHYHHEHYGHGMYPQHAHYYDIYDKEYIGRCQRPLRKANYAEINCKANYENVECSAKCQAGYTFPDNTTEQSNKCWHVTGVWRPTKNYPKCSPVCKEDCLNGGSCSRPGLCSCPPEYRGNRCQFYFLKCDVRVLTKEEKVGWSCTHSKNETVCNIRCPVPGEFETPAAEEYKCTPDGTWTPDSIPRCIVKDKEKEETTTPSS